MSAQKIQPFIAAGAVLIALLTGGVILLATTFSKSTCLDAGAYQEYVGQAPKNLDPAKNFYTLTVVFQSGSTDFADSKTVDNRALLYRLGDFYKKHSNIPQTYTITAARVSEDNWYLAQDRIDTVRAVLEMSGIPADSITQNSVLLNNYARKNGLSPTAVTVRITSPQKCSE